MILGEDKGYSHPAILAGFIIAIATFVSFIALEKRTRDPLLNLSLFHNGLFSLSIFCSFISFVSINSVMIIQPFYLQNTLKYSPAVTGLILMVYPIVTSIVAPISGHLSDKIGSEFLTFLGLALVCAHQLGLAHGQQPSQPAYALNQICARFRQCREYVKDQLPGRASSFDLLGNALKTDALIFQLSDDANKIRQATLKPIQPPNHERVTRAQRF